MLSPSDVSIDPVDGDTVCLNLIVEGNPLHSSIAGFIIFTKWQEMEKSK